MAQVEVKVAKSKSYLVPCFKERIELLFDVSIVVQTSGDGDTTGFVDDGNLENSSFTLQLSSSSSSENVQKAHVFLIAVLGESKDFIIERDSFSPKDFDMVRKASQSIERQSLSVLEFDFGAREVCIKGQQHNVEAAKLQISELIMGPHNFSTTSQTSKHSQAENNRGLMTQTSAVSNREGSLLTGKSAELFGSASRDVDNNVIVESCQSDPMTMRSCSLTTDAEAEFPSISGADLIDRGPSIMSPTLTRSFAEVVSFKDSSGGSTDAVKSHSSNEGAESSSDHSSSALSDEDSGANVVDKSDPRYESRLEFAVKLGYTERDLDKVIIRHGMECNEDKLLHELIENSAGSAQPDSEMPDIISPSTFAAPDFTSSEVFLGVMKKVSKSEDSGSNLRHIVIDGSNVAMSHGKNVFSCRGIKIAVDWFRQRGHEEITVFVPQWRKETSRPDTPIIDQEILTELEKEGIVVFTPARRIKGRRVVCYDDRFVLKLAAETNGIVVSNDNYRDLLNENKEFRTVVDERLLMYTFVNDRFMPPEDPLGRRGPTLDNFLCKESSNPPSLPPECPYGRKCTYGNKCKYHHPERGSQPHKTVTEVLKEQATLKMQERAVKGPEPIEKVRRSKPKLTRTRSLAPGEAASGEKTSALSPLPPALQESDSDIVSRRKSPTRSGGKTADYLREHRKKLEEMLAISSAAESASAKEQTGGSSKIPGPIAPPVSHQQEVLSPVPALGSRVSSPSHLNVPFSSSQEGQLVRGHLLLAKKLSDETSESSFFSNESSSNRASPVALAGPGVPGINPQESVHIGHDKLYDRRPSLQDHHRHQQYYHPYIRDMESGLVSSVLGGGVPHPSQQPSGFQPPVSGFGGQCQSYPGSDKEGFHNVLRRVTSYCEQPPQVPPVTGGVGMESAHRDHLPLKPQHSCPPSQFPPTPAPFTGQPFGGMVRQNSSSDPQLHMAGSSDASFSPWHATSVPPPPLSMLESRGPGGGRPIYGASDHRGQSEAQQQQQQQLFRSTSVQPFRTQQPYGSHAGLDRQISEVMLGSHDQGMGTSSPYMAPWEMGGMYHTHSHPTTPTHHPHTLPHQVGGMPPSTTMSPWSQGAMGPQMPVSPMKSTPQPSRSFPAERPIPATDPRYSLYYNLCGIFAEHRVRAVMNRFPDERDPRVLCASIVSEL